MKTIHLNKGCIDLPDTWSDLTTEDKRYAFSMLMLLFSGDITPDDFRIKMMLKITGYRPPKNGIVSFIRRFFRILRFKTGSDYEDYIDAEGRSADTVRFNLLRLSDQLDFAFHVEDQKIIPNYFFNDNPFPTLSPDAPHFLRKYTIDTNITAKQYVDALDLLQAISEDVSEDTKHHLLIKVAEILYILPYDQAKSIPADMLFGISFWFTGIVKFFKEHPTYSILFGRPDYVSEGDANPFSLGHTEVMLYLQKEGYGVVVEDMSLVDFFNAQVKALKDSVSRAISSGAKPEDIAQKSGLSLYFIHSLK